MSSPVVFLHLLQQDFDEPLLFRTTTWKQIPIPRELAEFAVRLESEYLKLWVAAMVNKVEEVDEDRFEDLEMSAMFHSLQEYDSSAMSGLQLPFDTE